MGTSLDFQMGEASEYVAAIRKYTIFANIIILITVVSSVGLGGRNFIGNTKNVFICRYLFTIMAFGVLNTKFKDHLRLLELNEIKALSIAIFAKKQTKIDAFRVTTSYT